jgi:hypothetical protein
MKVFKIIIILLLMLFWIIVGITCAVSNVSYDPYGYYWSGIAIALILIEYFILNNSK